MTIDEQAIYWNEYTLALERAGFTREEAVQMVTAAMCTGMWIVAFVQQPHG
jgi:hypothetical protein